MIKKYISNGLKESFGSVIRYVAIGALFVVLALPKLAYSQLNTTPITGTIRIDQGVVESNLSLTIEVDIRGFSINPISYPIISTKSTNVTLAAGQSSVAYSFNPLIIGGVFYSLNVSCASCPDVSSLIYYTSNGNTYSFSNSVILDRDEIPSSANFVLRTFSSVSGLIALEDGKLADKNLSFGVNAFNASTNEFLRGQAGFIVKKGTNSTLYNLSGVPRAIAPNGFKMQAVCFNCSGQQETFEYPQTISSLTNHSDINFIIPVSKVVFLPAIIELLLE